MPRRTALALVDGEHYPPVVAAALDDLRARGTDAVAAVVLGGSEKISAAGGDLGLDVPATWAAGAGGRADVAAAASVIRRLVAAHAVDVVVDLSDEPVLDARCRLQLASHVLHAGVAYEGADFRFEPPPRPVLTRRPTIAVIGTGKRTGKTAVAGALARALIAAGRVPVLVAMGRGGPPAPVVVEAGAAVDAASLLAIADSGGHAASDFYEDAATTGAATVGARRCGGGLAGAVGYANVAAALEVAETLPGDVVIVEGSGAAIPPAHADATLLVVPGDADPELVRGYLGAYRLLLADLVLATMCESPRSSAGQVEAVVGAIRSISRRTPVLRTVFRPVPLGPVNGAKVFLATTAPAAATAQMRAALEAQHGCEVVAASSHLADRPALRAELAAAPAFDVLLMELKAAAVDVAVRYALEVGARVVVCDHHPVAVDQPAGFDEAARRLLGLADQRRTAR